AIMLLDEQGFFDCNQATLKMLGYKNKNELTSVHPADVSPAYQPNGVDSMTEANQRIAEAFKNGTNRFEWVHRRKEGEDFPAEVLLTAFTLGKRNVLQATTRDLTEQKEAEKTLASMQAQILQSEKMASIGQLAAGVAHEINNPIGFIKSNLGTLSGYVEDLASLIHKYEELAEAISEASEGEKGALSEAIDRYKEEIDYEFVINDLEKLISESREGAERVKKIVADLKDFSHVDEPDLQYADVNKCIESTLNIVRNELKYKTTVTKDLGDVPEIYCYPNKLNQVFMNLLVNAAQAIEKSGEIRISTRLCNSDGPCVEIKISDTGSGIPQKNLSRIFDPFFTTKPVGKGTGLGLNMAYGIIEKHHGRIDVESEVGKGTTFTIVLPVRDEG
ncbi:MAG: ATP-binding protein, partial [Pseudomonadota bacterium]